MHVRKPGLRPILQCAETKVGGVAGRGCGLTDECGRRRRGRLGHEAFLSYQTNVPRLRACLRRAAVRQSECELRFDPRTSPAGCLAPYASASVGGRPDETPPQVEVGKSGDGGQCLRFETGMSSALLPAASASTNQAGRLPRPVQVRPSFDRYFGTRQLAWSAQRPTAGCATSSLNWTTRFPYSPAPALTGAPPLV